MSENNVTSRNYAIDDAGEKIGGARKDWRDRFMTVDDLEEMTNAEAVQSVKKDNVWPQPDWENVVASGVPAETAAYVKLIRDRIAKEPRFVSSKGQDVNETRKGYVEMLTLLRESLMEARSVADVKSVYWTIVDGLELNSLRADPRNRQKFFSVQRARACPFRVTGSDDAKVRTMLVDGFPSKVPAWRKGVRAAPASGGGFILVKNGRSLGEVFETEGAAWEWLSKSNLKGGAKQIDKGPKEPSRPHLDLLERRGMPDWRNGADVSADDFISTFGFRGVEFGLWLPDDERQRVLNLAYDSLHDMADILGWDPTKLSLDGSLAVAFGARGGGRFAAHYEPGRRVVNLTRLKGAGTLAHEYAHAFDHWAGEVDRDGDSRSVPSGTGWYHIVKNLKETLANLSDEQSSAWSKTVAELFSVAKTKEEAISELKGSVEEIDALITRYVNVKKDELEKPEDKRNLRYIREIDAYLKSQERRKTIFEHKIEKIEQNPAEVVLGRRTSDYAKQARLLCGKSGDYWTRPTEMFARAFESFVFDRLIAKGASSDYLVYAVEEDRYADREQYKGNPYPVGAERTAINSMIGDLVEAMRPLVERDVSTGPTP